MRIEEEHPDVLQNIEVIVKLTYQEQPELTDYAVLRMYEALVRVYTAEATNHEAKPVELTGLEATLFDDIRPMCEWHLGRGECPFEGAGEVSCTAIDAPTMVRCLKRLVKSVKFWTKEGGRQGYLEYISQFVA